MADPQLAPGEEPAVFARKAGVVASKVSYVDLLDKKGNNWKVLENPVSMGTGCFVLSFYFLCFFHLSMFFYILLVFLFLQTLIIPILFNYVTLRMRSDAALILFFLLFFYFKELYTYPYSHLNQRQGIEQPLLFY